jgi:phosphate transport system substrate-binding protein
MFYSKQVSLMKMGLLASIAVPLLIAGSSTHRGVVNAQDTPPSPTFTLPASLPSDAKVSMDGSNSMTGVTQALTKQFETKFPGAKITTESRGADEAIAALEKGEVDLASVGRALSADEKSRGLSYLPLKREKIAIVVGESNPFQGDITFEQFAKIFRGEITDWSELGGSPGPIRLIDRPETSDTRQSFNTYPVFKSAPFQAGATAQTVGEDNTNAMIKELGNDGIGYAIASHVLQRPGLRIVSMHKTLPDNPAYPFSQSRGYAYKDTSNPAVQAFLAVASSPEGTQAVDSALAAEVTENGGVAGTAPASGTATQPGTDGTSQSPAASAGAPAEQAQSGGGIPWLPILLGGGALAAGGAIWAATRGKGATGTGAAAAAEDDRAGIGQPAVGLGAIATGAGAAAGAAAAGLGAGAATTARTGVSGATGLAAAGATALGAGAAAVGLGALGRSRKGRAILTPRSEDTAYAYWEIPDEQKADCRSEGGRTMAARLYDVTDGDSAAHAQLINQVQCEDEDCDRHLAIPRGDRDYAVEVGYTTADNRWLPMVRSEKVHVPQSRRDLRTAAGIGGVGLAAAAGGTALAAGAAMQSRRPATTQDSRIILVPRSSQDAYAYWEVPEDHKIELHRQGGKTPKLRLHDVTYQPNQTPNDTTAPIQELVLTEQDQDTHIKIPVSGRNYVAEVGYETEEGRWLHMARSTATHVPYDWAATGIGGTGRDIPSTAVAQSDSKTILEAPPGRGFEGGVQLPQDPPETVPPVSTESPTILEVGEAPSPTSPSGMGAAMAAGSAAAAMGIAAAAAGQPRTVLDDEPTITNAVADRTADRCATQSLAVHSRHHCYQLTPEMVQQMQVKGVKQTLVVGQYLVKIRTGGFGYTSGEGRIHEPWVMLWLYGGRVINQKTGVSVSSTLSTLNGYDEVLTLDVLEPVTLSAFFVDTHVADNEGEVTLSIIQLDN